MSEHGEQRSVGLDEDELNGPRMGAADFLHHPGTPRRSAGHTRPAPWASGRSWRSKLTATSCAVSGLPSEI